MNPKVSCIMPVRGRRELALRAVECFLAQDYDNKELVILQDLEDRSFNDDETFPNVLIYGIAQRWSIGWKRNELCRLADGEFIAHWDSDDWSVSDRLSFQVEAMQKYGVSVCGFNSMIFTDGEKFGLYKGASNYCLGASLLYRREWWESHPFRDSQIGEDNHFVNEAASHRQLLALTDSRFMVARVHPGNTSKKRITDYKQIDRAEIPAEFLNMEALAV